MKNVTKKVAKELLNSMPSTVSEYNRTLGEYKLPTVKKANRNNITAKVVALSEVLELIANPPKEEKKERPMSDHSKVSQGVKNALRSFGGVRDWLLNNKSNNNKVELTLDNGSVIQHKLDSTDVKILEFTKPSGGAEQKRLRKQMYEFTKGKMYHHPKSGKTGAYYVSRSLAKHRDELVAKAVELGFMNNEQA